MRCIICHSPCPETNLDPAFCSWDCFSQYLFELELDAEEVEEYWQGQYISMKENLSK